MVNNVMEKKDIHIKNCMLIQYSFPQKSSFTFTLLLLV